MKKSKKSYAYRAVFLSDIHLGYKDCKAECLLNFLENMHCETLYLVGDIVDLWSLKKRVFWPKAHQQVLNKLLDLPNQGVRVIYIPGNHDEAMRDFIHLSVNQIEMYRDYEHITDNNERVLVLHGDAFDSLVYCAPLVSWIGDRMYDFLLFINRWFNRSRRMFGMPYWSLSGFIKNNINSAQNYIARYQKIALQYAKQKGYDGIICGHIHQPDLTHTADGVYGNCGDWIENCTFLVENKLGNIELIHWEEQVSELSVYAFAAKKIQARKAA